MRLKADIPTLSDAEWDTNKSITSLPVVYNGSAWRKIGAGFLRTLRNAAAVVSTAWNSLKNNGTSVSWIPTVDTSGNAGKTSPADLESVLGVKSFALYTGANQYNACCYYNIIGGYSLTILATFIRHSDSTESGLCNTQVFLVCAASGGVSVKRIAGSVNEQIRFFQKTGAFRALSTVAGDIQYKVLSVHKEALNSLSFAKENQDTTGYTRITIQD